MDLWPFTIKRWPGRELAIRRHMKEDSVFREIIGEYEIARTALQHWRAEDSPEGRKVADYERIVQELEEEIEAKLSPQCVPQHHAASQISGDPGTRAICTSLIQNPRETSQ